MKINNEDGVSITLTYVELMALCGIAGVIRTAPPAVLRTAEETYDLLHGSLLAFVENFGVALCEAERSSMKGAEVPV